MWDSTNIDKAFTLNIHQIILRIYFLSLPLVSFLTLFPLFFSLQMFDAYCVLILMPMQQAYIPSALFWWSCYCFWSVSKSSERKKNEQNTHTYTWNTKTTTTAAASASTTDWNTWNYGTHMKRAFLKQEILNYEKQYIRMWLTFVSTIISSSNNISNLPSTYSAKKWTYPNNQTFPHLHYSDGCVCTVHGCARVKSHLKHTTIVEYKWKSGKSKSHAI